ncbi:MAG: LamG domain-containing protein, partial [Verrucomicrobiae bacterium]|nr:LamG domain-containing protein [Verrucomicrobiae bacterium]
WAFSTGEMVAWWRFEESDRDRVLDASGRGHHGEFRGDAHIAMDTERGPVLSLDGQGDYLDCGEDPEFGLTTGFTLSAWVMLWKPNQFYDGIITKGDHAWRLQRVPDISRICLHATGLRPAANPYGEVESSTPLHPAKWHHLAGIFDGSRLTLYVNGRIESMASVPGGALATSNDPVYVGNNNIPGFNRCWIGKIDDVRIYRAALGRKEIAALYAGEGPTPTERPPWAR